MSKGWLVPVKQADGAKGDMTAHRVTANPRAALWGEEIFMYHKTNVFPGLVMPSLQQSCDFSR